MSIYLDKTIYEVIQEYQISEKDLPDIDDKMLAIYAQSVPEFTAAKGASLPLRTALAEIRETERNIRFFQKNETWLKLGAVALLALSIAAVACGILLAVIVSPAWILLGCAYFPQAFLASCLLEVRPYFLPPFLCEAALIAKIFHSGSELDELKLSKIKKLNDTRESLEALMKHRDQIKEKLERELGSVNLMDTGSKLEFSRIESLRSALQALKEAESLSQKLRGES